MTQTVLVIDDLHSVRRIMKRQLEEAGYDVLLASDGNEALALLEAPEVRVDLVITDLRMPGMDGRAFAAKLAQRPHAPRVLYMSGYPRPEGLVGHFVQKPLMSETLTRVVREVLAKLGEGE